MSPRLTGRVLGFAVVVAFSTAALADPPLGACCYDSGSCQVKTRLACEGPALCLGDLNCDGHVDFDDISPFVWAFNGESAYLAVYPNCHWLNGDCNGDSSVDFEDITPFVARMGHPCPPPGSAGQWLGAGTTCDDCPTCAPCPPDGIPEGEASCIEDYVDTYNGGCDAAVPAFLPIPCGQTICGITGTYWLNGSEWDDFDWYALTIESPQRLKITRWAEFMGVVALFDSANGCIWNPITELVLDACQTGTVRTGLLPPGTYWLRTQAPWPNFPCELNYNLTVSCDSTPVIPISAPFVGSGNTCAGGDDCDFVRGRDQTWEVHVPGSGPWHFSMCNPHAPQNPVLYISTWPCDPSSVIAAVNYGEACYPWFNWPDITLNLDAGTYYVTIESNDPDECFGYPLSITSAAVDCPGGAVQENEPVCYPIYVDTFDGGCDASMPLYHPIACGQTVCGHSGTFESYGGPTRDTDWYEFTLTSWRDVTFRVGTEFAVVVDLYNAAYGCGGLWAMAEATAGPYGVATLAYEALWPGSYWLRVAPVELDGVACGAQYVATLSCQPRPDYAFSAPFVSAGNTCGAGDDCDMWGWNPGAEEIWEIYIPARGTWTFSLCDTQPAWDTNLFLCSSVCDGLITNDYDACGPLSELVVYDLAAGTYYLLVEPAQSGDCGAYTLRVTGELN